jgi:hypothetical protein
LSSGYTDDPFKILEALTVMQDAGTDHVLYQVAEILRSANVQPQVIDNLVTEARKLEIVIGEVVSIQTFIPSEQQVVLVAPIKGKVSVPFRFPPNKQGLVFPEFQRAQNYGFIVRVSYFFQDKQNQIKSIEVVPRSTLGKK